LILGASDYTAAVDMWAFGCIVAEIVNRRLLFQALSNSDQLIEIMKVLGPPSK
jgi:serine/threonine protein kinase